MSRTHSLRPRLLLVAASLLVACGPPGGNPVGSGFPNTFCLPEGCGSTNTDGGSSDGGGH